MARTGGEILVDALIDWGVEVVFGIPGDGINGVMEALRRRREQIRFIQVRHEESAAFAACAYGKLTGQLGVCLATSGPGGLHLTNGLYDAKLDGAPVLAITGHHYHDLIDTYAQQDVDLDRVFEDVAVYNTRVMGPEHVENVAHLACRTALARRGVAHICFPTDYQTQTAGDRSPRNIPGHNRDVFAQWAGLPGEADLHNAAEVLNAGRKVTMLVGQGALQAGDLVEAVADRLGAPIVKALLGKAVVPDTSPLTTGSIGLLGTAPSEAAMKNCDTLLIVGSSFPYIEFYPKPGSARGVQVDLDPTRIALRYPVEVGLAGDSRRVLELLLPRLEPKRDRSFLESAQRGMRDWWGLMEERERRAETPLKPQAVVAAVDRRLRDDAIVITDSGTITTWAARHIRIRAGQQFTLSGTLASMANGLPYAIAAQLAYPQRQVVAIVGDGGLSMLMADFATAVKYELPIVVLVMRNNELNQIRWEQMVFLGNPEYGVDLQPIDFASVARACGGTGVRLERPEDVDRILDEAFATHGPVIIDAIVDPLEPPMPPRVSADQAIKFVESLIRGQPDRAAIARTAIGEGVRELV